MLTPQEILEHNFNKSVVGGYHVAAVDEYLHKVANDYNELVQENTEIKGKLKTLADKIKEYRETEDSMRATLLSARKMASSMVEDAQDRAADIVAEAERQAEEKLQSLREEITKEEKRLRRARKECDAFFAQMRNACEKCVQFLDSAPMLQLEDEEKVSEDASEPQEEERDGEENSSLPPEEEDDSSENEQDFRAVLPADTVDKQEEKPTSVEDSEEGISSGDTMVYPSTKLDDLRFGRDQRSSGRKKRGKS